MPDIPWRQNCLNQTLHDLVCDASLRNKSGRHAWDYADRIDLYHWPQGAVDIIEKLAEEKAHADMAK